MDKLRPHQPHKMFRHTETIRRQIADKLSVFDDFVGLALKGLTQKHWHCVIGNRFNVKERCSVDVLLFKFDFHYYFVSCKTQNHPQTSQTTDKPVKPPTNQPKASLTTRKPPKNQSNHSQTSQILDKLPKIQPIISRKLVFNITKNFSNNAKHVLNLQTFYSIPSTLSSEDQSQVGVEGKWLEII